MTTLIMAYMPAWKDPPEPQTVATWGNGPWLTTPPINYMGDHPERWPSYGAGNEDNQTIIDLHLQIAATMGVTAFSVNWYAGWAVEYGIQRLLSSTSTSPVKAFVQWSNHFDSMDAAHCNKPFLYEGIRLAALYMIGSYATRYYQRNSRPVLALFSTQHLDDTIRISTGQPVTYTPSTAERSALVADMRNVVGNVLTGDLTGGISGSTVSVSANPGPFLVIMDTTWGPVTGVDAMTYYSQHNVVINPGQPGQLVRMAHSFAEIHTGCQQTWGTGVSRAAPYGKEFWPTMQASGWDRTPWGGTPGDPLADNCKPSPQELRHHCELAKATAHKTTCNDTVFSYAFNESGESFPVSPTPGSGTMFVDTIKSVFTVPTGWVKIQGVDFLRPDGTKFFPFGTSTRWNAMEQSDFAYMASLGLNCVRIPFNVCGQSATNGDADAPSSPSTGYLDPTHLTQLDQFVDWTEAAGMLTHIVFRSPCYRNGMTVDGSGNPIPDAYCGNTTTYPNGSTVWTDASKKTRWLAQLTFLAARYASRPSVYMIEVLAEPDPLNQTGAQVNTMMAAGVAAVQAANPNILVMVGGKGAYAPGQVDASLLPGVPRVAYTYDWFNFSGSSDPTGSLATRAAGPIAFRKTSRIPLHVQQFGSQIGDDPEPRTILAFSLSFNVTNKIPCTQWELRTTGSPPPAGSYGWIDGSDIVRTTDETLMRNTATSMILLGGNHVVSAINNVAVPTIGSINGVAVNTLSSRNELDIS